MSATLELLKRYKELKHLRSNYAAAKALGISESTISGWLSGGSMDDSTAVQIAQEIGAEPIAVLAQVKLDRPLNPRERKIWSRYRARVPMALLAAVAIGGVSGHDAMALEGVANATTYTLCAVAIGALPFLARLQNSFRRRRIQWLRPLCFQQPPNSPAHEAS